MPRPDILAETPFYDICIPLASAPALTTASSSISYGGIIQIRAILTNLLVRCLHLPASADRSRENVAISILRNLAFCIYRFLPVVR